MNRRMRLIGMISFAVIFAVVIIMRKKKHETPSGQNPSGETAGGPSSGAAGNNSAPGSLSTGSTSTPGGETSAQNANQPGGVAPQPNAAGGAQPNTGVSGEPGKPNVAVSNGGQQSGAGETGQPKVAKPGAVDENGKPIVGGYAGAPDTTGLHIPGSKKTTQQSGNTSGQATIPSGAASGKTKTESGTASTAHQGTNLTSTQNQNTSNGGTAGAIATQRPVPTPTPDVRLKASPAESSCEEQWKQSEVLFKVGVDMAYMTNLSVQRPLAPDIATSHIETISKSSSSAIVRDIAFSSDHPTGILVLSSLNAAPSISTSRDSFLSLCRATGGRAISSALFKMSRARVLDIADENTKVGAGTFPSYHMKVEAAMLINEKVTTVVADIWMAKNKIGLPIKEVIKIGPKVFADHGSIAISSQLAGSRKL